MQLFACIIKANIHNATFCMQNVALCYMNICLVATPVQHVAENRNTFYFHATCRNNFKGCYGDGCEYT